MVTADGATIRVPADSISTIFYADQQEPIGSLEIEVKQGTMAAQMAHDELVQVTFERDLWRRVAEELQQKLDELTA